MLISRQELRLADHVMDRKHPPQRTDLGQWGQDLTGGFGHLRTFSKIRRSLASEGLPLTGSIITSTVAPSTLFRGPSARTSRQEASATSVGFPRHSELKSKSLPLRTMDPRRQKRKEEVQPTRYGLNEDVSGPSTTLLESLSGLRDGRPTNRHINQVRSRSISSSNAALPTDRETALNYSFYNPAEGAISGQPSVRGTPPIFTFGQSDHFSSSSTQPWNADLEEKRKLLIARFARLNESDQRISRAIQMKKTQQVMTIFEAALDLAETIAD